MDNKKITKIMKALSNPNRLELFMEISKKNETSYSMNYNTNPTIFPSLDNIRLNK